MTDSQKLRIAFVLVLAEIVLLAMTLGFKAVMDVQAQRAGIDVIIKEAGR